MAENSALKTRILGIGKSFITKGFQKALYPLGAVPGGDTLLKGVTSSCWWQLPNSLTLELILLVG